MQVREGSAPVQMTASPSIPPSQASEAQSSLGSLHIVFALITGKPFFQRPFLIRRLRGGQLLSTIASSSMMYNKV